MAGDPKDEYIDASNNARLFQTVRFAQLTIFMALTGGLLAVTFSKIAAPTEPLAAAMLKVGGILVTLLFWVLHERTMLYWRHFVARASELEAELGFRQYSSRPPAGLISGNNTMRALYVAMAVFWVVALVIVPTTS